MNFSKKMKIQTRLLISYFVIGIIPFLVVIQVIYYQSVKSLETTLLEMVAIFNSQVISNIEAFTEDYYNITKTILVDQDIITQGNLTMNPTISGKINNQLAVRKMLLRLEILKPDIGRVILQTKGGEIFQYGRSNDSVDTALIKEQLWLQELIEAKKTLSITALHNTSYYHQDKSRAILTVSRIILDEGGDYAGVLLIDLNSAKLIELNEEFMRARDKYNIKLTVTNNAGQIIYHSDMLDSSIPLRDFVGVVPDFSDGSMHDFIIMSKTVPNGEITVHTAIDRSDLLKEIKQIHYITTISTLICSSLAIIVSIFFSYSITKPIKNLKKSMKLAEGGEYHLICEPSLNDEMKTLVVSYNHMILKTKELIEDVYLAEIKQKNASLLALQAQINPHMLYNTLESIRMNAYVNGDTETAEMVKILARMFRFSLEKNTSKNTIKDEIVYLEDYAKLQNIRFDNRFELNINISESIMNSFIIALILQPIVENCIKHGAMGSCVLKIFITGRLTEHGNIIITVSDNGKGIAKEKIKDLNDIFSIPKHISGNASIENSASYGGIGLKNISDRIYLYYGSDYYLKILPNEKAHGTFIELMIPNNKEACNGKDIVD